MGERRTLYYVIYLGIAKTTVLVGSFNGRFRFNSLFLILYFFILKK